MTLLDRKVSDTGLATAPPAAAPAQWVHLSTPGDHYSSATGSAVQSVIFELSQAHERAGGRVRVVVGRGTRHDYPAGRAVVVDYRPLPGRKRKAVDILLGRAGLGRVFEAGLHRPAVAAIEREFDGVLLLHNAPASVRPIRRALPSARVALYCHNDLFAHYANAEVARVVDACDAVICCSGYVADGVRQKLGDRAGRDRAGRTMGDAAATGRSPLAGRVHVVRNGVNPRTFCPPQTEPATDARSGEPVVLFVGRILPIKGVHKLIEACVRQRGAGRAFKLRIVGSANFDSAAAPTAYQLDLRRLAEPLGDRVEFVPFRDRAQVVVEYQSADIFCVPSVWNEPCSLTTLEGMASGLPTLVARRGGLPEVAGEAGFLFDPDRPGEIDTHLQRLLDDPALRRSAGAASRDWAERNAWDVQHGLLCAGLGAQAGFAPVAPGKPTAR